MSKDERIELVRECLSALGSAWRGSWVDFDGRTLRSQLEDISGFFDCDMDGKTVDSEYRGFCEQWGICRKELCWEEFCDCEKEKDNVG